MGGKESMRRLAAGMMSVVIGLSGLSIAYAQSEAPTVPWNWLRSKKESPPPPKPSADPVPGKGTQQNAANPRTIHVLRQTSCHIPFTADTAKSGMSELHLYVSQDRGANWKLYAKESPAAGYFTFRAVADGEYWFALWGVKKSGSAVDTSKLSPGLKVVFDTHDPELHFEAQLNNAGEATASWKISDTTLDADSFKVEYQVEPGSPWLTVALPPSQERDGSLVGELTWEPESISDSMLVRAEVSDRAGNKMVVSRRLTSKLAAGKDEFHARSTSAQTYPVAHNAQDWPADNRMPATSQKAAVSPHGDLPAPNTSSTAKDAQAVRKPLVSAQQSVDSSTLPINPPAGRAVAETPAQPQSEEEVSAHRDLPNAVNSNQTTTVSPPVSDAKDAAVAQATTPVSVPHGERPRMTNSREFSLDYEVDPLGPAAVARVELWGTADGGRTWSHWQNDVDQISPLDVTVQQDGIFGFRIVIIGSNQLSSAPPQPGDPADLWVGVDTSQPTARLTAAIYGEGEHAGQLDIRWQAIDVWFTDRPITLQFSEHPQGPWIPIAAGLPNTGQYFWSVDPRIPRNIFLRIEACDEAGNVGQHQINEAISTAGLIPQGRIRGLRPNAAVPAEDRSAARPPAKR